MSMDDWIRIAIDIKVYNTHNYVHLLKTKTNFNILQRCYQIYDGFVILHGTDTLTYTASALSFMCENLGKTIVVTGSQVKHFF